MWSTKSADFQILLPAVYLHILDMHLNHFSTKNCPSSIAISEGQEKDNIKRKDSVTMRKDLIEWQKFLNFIQRADSQKPYIFRFKEFGKKKKLDKCP